MEEKSASGHEYHGEKKEIPLDEQTILNAEDEIRLFKLKETGNEEEKAYAREELITRNMKLVPWIVGTRNDLKVYGVSREELISFGYEALIKAVDSFDYKKGNKFSSYAFYKIYWGIKTQVTRRTRLIHVPVKIAESMNDVERARDKLIEQKEKQGLSAKVSAEEIADTANLPVKLVVEVLKAIQLQEQESLEELLGNEYNDAVDSIEEGIILDRGEPNDFVIEEDELSKITETLDVKEKIDMVLKTLGPKEEEVIRLRMGLLDGHEWTLREIGRRNSVTGEYVRQLEDRGLKKLKKYDRKKYLEGYEKNEEIMDTDEVSALVRNKKEENEEIFSADLSRVDLSTSEVLSRIKEVVESNPEKAHIFMARAINFIEETNLSERIYLLRYIYHFMNEAKKPTFRSKDENGRRLAYIYASSPENKEAVAEIENYFKEKSAILLRNTVFKFVKNYEPSKMIRIERNLACQMESYRNSKIDKVWKDKLEEDIDYLFMRRYKANRTVDTGERHDKVGIKRAQGITKIYLEAEYDYRKLAINALVDYRAQYDNQELAEPNLLSEEKVIFDSILEKIEALRGQKREEDAQKSLGEEMLQVLVNLKDSYQDLEYRLQERRNLEIQLRNKQEELMTEKERVIEYIEKLKMIIEANKEMLIKMMQLSSLYEALRRAQERLAEIEAENLEYQNQINRIIQEQEQFARQNKKSGEKRKPKKNDGEIDL